MRPERSSASYHPRCTRLTAVCRESPMVQREWPHARYNTQPPQFPAVRHMVVRRWSTSELSGRSSHTSTLILESWHFTLSLSLFSVSIHAARYSGGFVVLITRLDLSLARKIPYQMATVDRSVRAWGILRLFLIWFQACIRVRSWRYWYWYW